MDTLQLQSHLKQNSTVLFTYRHKLAALSYRFYQGIEWTAPKAGDYYTTPRNDLELYHVVKIENGIVFTEYCSLPGVLTEWPESEFTSVGFGPQRTHVPNFIFEVYGK